MPHNFVLIQSKRKGLYMLGAACVSPLFSSSSWTRTRVSSQSSILVPPLFSMSFRLMPTFSFVVGLTSSSSSASFQECFVIISTLSLIGVVEAAKPGLRLPLPPPPLPPLVQPIIPIVDFQLIVFFFGFHIFMLES